jgi:hypothetical protein
MEGSTEFSFQGEADLGMPDEPYYTLVVETYYESGSGLHGDEHVRCVEGQPFPSSLRIRSPKEMRRRYPVGTRFQIYAKLTDKEGGSPFLHTHHNWPYVVLND